MCNEAIQVMYIVDLVKLFNRLWHSNFRQRARTRVQSIYCYNAALNKSKLFDLISEYFDVVANKLLLLEPSKVRAAKISGLPWSRLKSWARRRINSGGY